MRGHDGAHQGELLRVAFAEVKLGGLDAVLGALGNYVEDGGGHFLGAFPIANVGVALLFADFVLGAQLVDSGNAQAFLHTVVDYLYRAYARGGLCFCHLCFLIKGGLRRGLCNIHAHRNGREFLRSADADCGVGGYGHDGNL